jgi:hypothetical protein
MAAIRYKSRNGRSYPDTPGGWLDEARDSFADKLRLRGHEIYWRKVGRVSHRTRATTHYHLTCRKCHGELDVGEDWTKAAGQVRMTTFGVVRYCPGKGRR